MILYEKETGRVIKYMDRESHGSGSVWKGLQTIHFMNGAAVSVEQVGTIVRCPRIHRGSQPWFHKLGCTYEHKESPNPFRNGQD